MADFELAIQYLLPIEGGISTNPHDMGGATKYGISLNFLKLINPNATDLDILNLTPEKAKAIYKEHFWDHYRIGEVLNQFIANKFFNIIVNMSPGDAIKILQNAVVDVNRLSGITVDGTIGSRTLSAVNSSNTIALLLALKIKQAQYYLNEVERIRSQMEFLPGWIRRALND